MIKGRDTYLYLYPLLHTPVQILFAAQRFLTIKVDCVWIKASVEVIESVWGYSLGSYLISFPLRALV